MMAPLFLTQAPGSRLQVVLWAVEIIKMDMSSQSKQLGTFCWYQGCCVLPTHLLLTLPILSPCLSLHSANTS